MPRLEDVLDIPRLQSVLDSLYAASGIPSAIIDNDGTVHAGAGWQDVCTKFHRVNHQTLAHCIESDKYITSHILEAQPSVTYRCPRGLVDTATPIIIEGRHLGNVFTGQLFLEPPDFDFYRGQAQEFGFDEAAYLSAVAKVPIISERTLQEHLAFIAHLTNIFAEMGLNRMRERAAERQRRESAEQYRAIVRTAMDGYWLVDRDGTLLEVNDSYARMSGYAEAELIGRRVADLEANESLEQTLAHIARVREHGFDRFESQHRRKDGSVFAVEVSVQCRGDEHDELVVFLRDISERKRAEEDRAKLEAQLFQAMKMESVGRLAGGIAHDFNNMLGVIIGHCELAVMHGGLSNAVRDDLWQIHHAASRSAELTRQLLSFARKGDVMPRVLDLNATIDDALKMLLRLIGEEIRLEWRPGAGVWPVSIDPAQLELILVNLSVNARDAIASVGTIEIDTANVSIDHAFCVLHANAMVGDFVRLSVVDDGPGMDSPVLEHIFDPFFTTKAAGHGTGLGLASVHGAVSQAGGFISVESAPGAGARFDVYLPRVANGSAQSIEAAEELPVARGNEAVLLVEDEPAVLALTARFLVDLGYKVVRASGAAAAMQLFGEERQQISLLLTDTVMPEMSGSDLAEAIRAQAPHLPVLFMSGFSADKLTRAKMFKDRPHFLAKPFTRASLARAVRECLDAPVV